jgi:hypothetical protein
MKVGAQPERYTVRSWLTRSTSTLQVERWVRHPGGGAFLIELRRVRTRTTGPA